jgi:hypothetical protein
MRLFGTSMVNKKNPGYYLVAGIQCAMPILLMFAKEMKLLSDKRQG